MGRGDLCMGNQVQFPQPVLPDHARSLRHSLRRELELAASTDRPG
jgi:hypothetical protein